MKPNNETMSHMPFLVADRDGNRTMFHCRADAPGPHGTRAWKLWVTLHDGRSIRIATGFSQEVCECSPSAWHDESGWHVSFVAGGATEDPVYRLYRMDGESLERLSMPVAVQVTRAGFVRGDRLVWAEVVDFIHVRDRRLSFDIEIPGAAILRVSSRADATEVLVITGMWQADKEFFTLEYDLHSGRQYLVEVDGRPAYKCTFLGDEVLDGQRLAGGIENRRIVSPLAIKRSAAHVAVRYLLDRSSASHATGGCGCHATSAPTETITRTSCLECVEKHLGAAYVLLTETRDGYAHRLRAVGHLHEAEDESQEWMALHAAIRAARKAYQRQGTIPDWQMVESLVEAVRPVPAN